MDEIVVKQIKEVGDKVDGFKKENEDLKKEIKEAKDSVEQIKKSVENSVTREDLEKTNDSLLAEIKKQKSSTKTEEKSFTVILGDALSAKKDELARMKSKSVNDISLQLKAATDENQDFSNFGTGAYALGTTERRGLYMEPFAPVWLRDVLPNASTQGSTIQYLRENGGEGAAGVWDGTTAIPSLAAKPGVDFDFSLVTENIIWIAGITRVKREMLDDVSWLQSYISQQLTVGKRGLFVAENTQVFTALDANSTAYDGTNTIPVEMLYDAAFGQLKDNYYNPNVILMNSRDVVNLIVLNKANTSGLYNLPAGTVAVVNNQLYLGGIPVIGIPNVPAGEALVFDRNATQFVSRMNPEVRLFEQDRDNVPLNLITVRAEERMAALVFDNTAIIKVKFGATT